MSTQKAKFELFARLQALGFTYDEAASLRRIEMTLHRWAEAECNGEIQREERLDDRGWDQGDGKPFRVYGQSHQNRYPIADREAGALRRLAAIVKARNKRATTDEGASNFVFAYHQGDCRGCMLYLVTRGQLREVDRATIERHSGKNAARSEESRLQWTISQYYNNGLAICA
jgi:hypothetical protein